MHTLLLFLASVFAGALNAAGGGGTFFTFPLLLLTGMPPIVANATNTIAIWPGTIACAVAYRKKLGISHQFIPMLAITSLTGSALGALTLLNTPEQTFSCLVPYLLLLATCLFAFSRTITIKFFKQHGLRLGIAGACILQMVIGFYGGYFGGGMGIMILAMLSLMGMTAIHEMNALRAFIGVVINAVAVGIFIAARLIAWPQACIMIFGTVIGGFWGAKFFATMKSENLRIFVIATGLAMSLYFFMH